MPIKLRGRVIIPDSLEVEGDTTLKDVDIELDDFWHSADDALSMFTGVTKAKQAEIAHVASAVNYPSIKGAIASAPVEIAAAGTDTNIGVRLTPKGTGNVEVTTGLWKPSDADIAIKAGATAIIGASVKHVASAVNYLALTPSITTASAELAAEGSDTNISVKLTPKGTGVLEVPATVNHTADADVNLGTGATAIVSAVLKHVASAVNHPALTPSATGDAIEVAAEGTDTDIGITLTPKGTGAITLPAGIVGVAPVVITDAAGYTMLASNSGKLHVIPDMAQNCTIDLPAEAAGLNYKFIYGGAAAEAHDHTIDSEADVNFFIGGVTHLDADAGPGADEVIPVYADGNSNSKLTLSNVEVGTVVEIWCDGTNWYITGIVVSDTAPAFADQ